MNTGSGVGWQGMVSRVGLSTVEERSNLGTCRDNHIGWSTLSQSQHASTKGCSTTKAEVGMSLFAGCAFPMYWLKGGEDLQP